MKLFLSANLPYLKTTILGLLFIVFGVQFHSGVKEHYLIYFVLPAIFCPIAIMIFSKNQILKDICLSISSVLIFWLCAEIFWDYMDRPWFSPEPTHEGQYGWFSFENDLKWKAFLIFGGVSTILGVISRYLRNMFVRC